MHHFALRSFTQFLGKDSSEGRGAFDQFEIIAAELSFRNALPARIGKLIYNLSSKTYERYFAWLFPAKNIKVRLRICKKGA